jgi:3-hydroxybutyryl-CoA dehydrogenase
MGTGIGIVASRVAGLNVTFVDPSANQLKQSEAFIKGWCLKEIAKERLTQADMDGVLSRI